MTVTLSDIAQAIYYDLGQAEMWVCSGGSTTTAVIAELAYKATPPSDDHYNNAYMLFVRRTTDGDAPQGEYSRVTDYVSSTTTLTIGALTAALQAGDEVALCKQNQFPYTDVFAAVNRALELGTIALMDTSLTTASGQTEYAIPAALRFRPPIEVLIQTNTGDSDDNQYVPISDWRVIPGSDESVKTLVIPQQSDGYTLALVYEGEHPAMTAYNSTLNPSIRKSYVVAAARAALLERYNNRLGGTDRHWNNMYVEAVRQREALKAEFSVWKPSRKPRMFVLE